MHDGNDGSASKPIIGFLGLGQMGGRMVPHLVAAGYEVVAFDPKDDRLEAATAAGAAAAEDARDAVRRGEVVMASLRSSAMFVEVAESDMLPHAVAGQVVLDMGVPVKGP